MPTKGHPHPEDSARAAGMDGRSDTDDVACPDRSGQGRAQGLEAVYVAFALVLGREDELQRSRQAEDLEQMEADSQHQAGADEQHQQGRTPDKTINGIQRF